MAHEMWVFEGIVQTISSSLSGSAVLGSSEKRLTSSGLACRFRHQPLGGSARTHTEEADGQTSPCCQVAQRLNFVGPCVSGAWFREAPHSSAR
ncbi:hypothetical protein GJAV_G00084200 [Gymnothorax javanicus]|nr:hypothetical protein GJAV_G00084200 [Gymnothorax javanicus]